MDLHAHLSGYEVIGLLAGHWDAERRHLVVAAAHACARAAGSAAPTSVELDAASQIEAQGAMEAAGRACVGWYHSHPLFVPQPSLKDAANQANYQSLFRSAASGAEPFIGAIVSPYDTRLPSPRSAVNFFVVQARPRAPAPVPFALQTAVVPPGGAAAGGADAAPRLRAAALAVVASMAADVARTDLRALWRPFSTLAGGAVGGPPLRKLHKLLASLRGHLGGGCEPLLAELAAALAAAWGAPELFGLAAADPTAPPSLPAAAPAPPAAPSPPAEPSPPAAEIAPPPPRLALAGIAPALVACSQ
jgi:protein MYSM1